MAQTHEAIGLLPTVSATGLMAGYAALFVLVALTVVRQRDVN